ncbi:hypothetical protein LWI29_002482 [Acer saccharum]|uniref:Uncharacterized protein n=1 Tax=Acer saccharum TaxID=4024 RepID=A0AA39W1R9_ACESA|nr:hypothetical protein LWI29_002482 [Acer saccharum]
MKKLKYAGSLADRVVRAEAEAAKVAEQLKKTKVSGHTDPYFVAVNHHVFHEEKPQRSVSLSRHRVATFKSRVKVSKTNET